nr:CCE_0567 family metalloprotein [Ensifer aridi]
MAPASWERAGVAKKETHDLIEEHLRVNWAEVKATAGKRFDVTLQRGTACPPPQVG